MKLNNEELTRKDIWNEAEISLPLFDRETVAAKTRREPTWIHFGAGNIFRAFPAAVLQKLLDLGRYDRGVIVSEGYDYDIIPRAYRPFDNLSLLVILKADGSIRKQVVGSVTESLVANRGNQPEWNRHREIFASPSLQMVSFTITEKGYAFLGEQGIIAKVTDLLLHRFEHGAHPLALVSMDNCSHNGEKLGSAVRSVARRLVEEGRAPAAFLGYLDDKNRVSFPWTMIDKITPRPDAAVSRMLEDCGFADTALIVTEKNTYTAPFVNAEEAQYLVVEDRFPNGRPPLELGGVIFTDRDTVNLTEKMKVCTCLNPLHTALAVFGCLLGFQSIHEEMADADLNRMVEILGYQEGLPVVADPKIISPSDFIKEVLEVRLPNPFMPDTPQRIATDTSQKLPIRFGETVKAYLGRPDLHVESLKIVPLVFAGWCRYLLGTDDGLCPMALSPDPRLDELGAKIRAADGRSPESVHAVLAPILRDASVWGVDLYEAGLGEKTEEIFCGLLEKGAVRRTLHHTVC